MQVIEVKKAYGRVTGSSTVQYIHLPESDIHDLCHPYVLLFSVGHPNHLDKVTGTK